jgi:hypothetical protein
MERGYRIIILSIGLLVVIMAVALFLKPSGFSTPTEAFDALLRALETQDEDSVRALTTEEGFRRLWAEADSYVEKGRGLGSVLSGMRPFIARHGWTPVNATHVGAGVRWRTGDGQHRDSIVMEKTPQGWKLDDYHRIYEP